MKVLREGAAYSHTGGCVFSGDVGVVEGATDREELPWEEAFARVEGAVCVLPVCGVAVAAVAVRVVEQPLGPVLE